MEDELRELAAIRERLKSLEERLGRHEADSRARSDKTELAISELAKTVSSLSTTMATISVRLATPSPPPYAPTSLNSAVGPIAAGSGLAGAIIAAVTYVVTKMFGG